MVQKVIKIGSSAGVTIPVKEMRRQNIKLGDEVEVIIRTVSKSAIARDQAVIDAARRILNSYKKDFQNLAKK